MTRGKHQTQPTEPAAETTTSHQLPVHREPGDEQESERQRAPDPFTISSDYAAGVKLREHRRFRRAELEFADGKPSQQVIDKLKADHFRWHPQDQLWVRPVSGEDRMATRIEAERTYQDVVALIRQEKGITTAEKAF